MAVLSIKTNSKPLKFAASASHLLKVWFSWFWFDGISTIVGYLMQNPFLYI